MSDDNDYRMVIVDLFCGGGGFSTGLVNALINHFRSDIAHEQDIPEGDVVRTADPVIEWLDENTKVIAVNHWQPAVNTYEANHPYADVHNARVQALHPPDAVDGHEVDLLIAGPSCIPHSRAKGGPADDDQKRMGPRHVSHWLELLRPTAFVLENVPTFKKWGPLKGTGDNKKMVRDGSYFEDWLSTLQTFGYSVDHKILLAADYGDPQSRRRLFIQGRLNYRPEWPEPTHSENAEKPGTLSRRTASEIIDWSDPGESMWTKSRPLVQKTNARIADGIRKHGHDGLAPFADVIESLTKQDVKEMQESVVPIQEAAEAAEERDEPFFVKGPVLLGNEKEQSATSRSLSLPMNMAGGGSGICKLSTEEQVPTITAKGGCIHHIDPEAFILPRNGRCWGIDSNPAYEPGDETLHTITAKNHDGRYVESSLLPLYTDPSEGDSETVNFEQSVPSTPSSNPAGVSRPFLVKYYGNSSTASLRDAMPTITTTDTLALCVPRAYPWGLDVRYRMLKPSELAQGQGFSKDYQFTPSTKKEITELIGNAVPVGVAQSLCEPLLKPTNSPTLANFGQAPEPKADIGVGD